MVSFPAFLQVALGGALGSVARHAAVQGIGAPWGVALVNVAGSFAIGLAFVLLPGPAAPFVMTGILGGFTTFSAFSLDALRLWQAGRTAEAALYTGGSVALSLAAVALGATLARSLA